MALLTTVQTLIGGAVSTLVAASAGGDKFGNTGRERFRVRNGSGVSINVTFTATGAAGCPEGTLHDKVVAVAAGAEKVFGPFDPARFNDANNQVSAGYSAVTSVTVGVES
jgi:hypothetical protein